MRLVPPRPLTMETAVQAMRLETSWLNPAPTAEARRSASPSCSGDIGDQWSDRCGTSCISSLRRAWSWEKPPHASTTPRRTVSVVGPSGPDTTAPVTRPSVAMSSVIRVPVRTSTPASTAARTSLDTNELPLLNVVARP